MPRKEFVPYDLVRHNAIVLAHTIYSDGFVPDVIYVSLRGGAYLGNIISEYFKLISEYRQLKPVLYAAVVARSYAHPSGGRARVNIDGWTYHPRYLRAGDKVLLVDDIFDTGYTINALARDILQNNVMNDDLKIAVHDYKERSTDARDASFITPDYYSVKYNKDSDKQNSWVHYLSHELVGLSEQEISDYFPADIAAILHNLGSV